MVARVEEEDVVVVDLPVEMSVNLLDAEISNVMNTEVLASSADLA